MLAWITTDHRRLALGAGLFYTTLYILSRWAVWGAARWLAGRSGPSSQRARRWPGWTVLGQASSLVLAIGFLLLALLGGMVAASDVGLGAVDWPALWPWVALPTLGFALWLALLWGVQRHKRVALARAEGRGAEGGIALLAEVLEHEATLALYRGALMPWLGSYWGLWLAVIAGMLAARTDPWVNARLQRPIQRRLVLLEWATLAVSTLLFLFSGSLWAALGGHILCRAVVWGVQRGLAARRPSPTDLAQDQGQYDEGGEHAGSDDAQTLQIT